MDMTAMTAACAKLDLALAPCRLWQLPRLRDNSIGLRYTIPVRREC
jgi:hypothetical protein